MFFWFSVNKKKVFYFLSSPLLFVGVKSKTVRTGTALGVLGEAPYLGLFLYLLHKCQCDALVAVNVEVNCVNCVTLGHRGGYGDYGCGYVAGSLSRRLLQS